MEELLKADFETSLFNSGQVALNCISEINPDIILLDILMPGMDGMEVLKKLKESDSMRSIPVIMVTAKSQREDVKLAVDAVAVDYVKKPIDYSELVSKIDLTILNKNRMDKLQGSNDISTNSLMNLQESLFLASRIQSSLLADKNMLKAWCPDSFLLNLPKDVLSGDYYWMRQIGQKLFFSIFDCTGHGVPGAMLSIMGHMILKQIIVKENIHNPSCILEALRDEMDESLNISADTYVSLTGMDGIMCVLHREEMILEFSSACRSLVIIRKGGKKLIVNREIEVEPVNNIDDCFLYEIRTNKYYIDSEYKTQNYENYLVSLEKNDRVFLFSDGFSSQLGGSEQRPYSTRKFMNSLLLTSNINLDAQKQYLHHIFTEWKGGCEQTDDLLLFCLQV